VKVLIIGATGSTGRILLEKALEQGHQVTALARNPSSVAPREYSPRVLGGNVLDPEAVEAAVAGLRCQDRSQSHASSYRESSKRFTSPPMNASAIFEVHSKRLLSLTMA
jgi:putative NADH-flavin reductase